MHEERTASVVIGIFTILGLPVLTVLRLAGIITMRTDRIISLCLIVTWLVSRCLEFGDLGRPRG